MTLIPRLAATLLAVAIPGLAWAQESEAELAKKLANPISDLISVPFQNNYDCCYGPADGYRYTLYVQPVIPIGISEHWNMISRTIVPIIYQEQTTPDGKGAGGFGDIVQSLFFSPRASKDGFVWGVGPVFLLPLGNEALGSQKWGIGPTIVVLKQKAGISIGMLANQIWSVAGNDKREDVSALFLQPFFNYTTAGGTGFLINTESSYNWKTEQWTAPINVGVSHMVKFGDQRVQLAGIGRYYASSPAGGPEWGLRLVATLLYPKK